MHNESGFFTLNDGNIIPAVGLGTFPMKGETLLGALQAAKEAGYTYFDTSPAYGNEAGLTSLYDSRIPFWKAHKRKKYCVQTKLFLDFCISHNEKTGLKKSLHRLRSTYVDVYLMHWAYPDTFVRNYQAMEELRKEGLVKSIGVANMEIHHLQAILNKCAVPPAINQVEVTPMLTQKPLIEFCKANGIHVQAYTPFARMDERLFSNPVLQELAQKHGKKITQIILRWNIQQGRSVVPKSESPERLRENISLHDFTLSQEELERIDSINQDLRVRFHPDVYPLDWRRQRDRRA